MAEETKVAAPIAPQSEGYYGYESDEVKVNPFLFGLNANCSYLTKFEFTPTGGKDGAEQDALDIVFKINGTEKSMRKFPVVKAFRSQKDGGGEVTDPKAPEMIEAFRDFRALVVHVLHCFRETDVIKAALSRPFSGFKEYCQVATSLIPKDFDKIPLDVFLQYQWQMSEGAKRTYLDFPKSLKQGYFLAKSTGEKWTKLEVPNAEDSDNNALRYVIYDADGKTISKVHPFIRSGWFMKQPYAHQQVTENEAGTDAQPVAVIAAEATSTEAAAKASW